jgi:DNA-directed RNA polymerase
MRVGKDEIDKGKHASGIVANYIHSLDSAHLARTAARFRDLGGTSFGAIHDCLLSRPSETHLQGLAVRETFRDMYGEDPLTWPVRMRARTKAGVETLEEYPSWLALAESMGVEFPERGTWEPSEVLESAWFFS